VSISRRFSTDLVKAINGIYDAIRTKHPHLSDTEIQSITHQYLDETGRRIEAGETPAFAHFLPDGSIDLTFLDFKAIDEED
jgi:hypothetical protein